MNPAYLLASLITLPEATTTLQSIGQWSGSFFSELLPIALIGAGLIVGGLIASWLLGVVVRAAGKLFGRGRTSRRRGRR
jgi:hypothetical protein